MISKRYHGSESFTQNILEQVMGNLLLLVGLTVILSVAARAQDDLMAGYLGAPMKKVSSEYGAGFSMYVAAWPLLETYPGRRFQTGLFGTWMFAQKEKPARQKKAYSDIEGGLGWWRDTRFATETPKFIMGGVALNFSAWANGPGAGKGRDWSKPRGKYGVAQLSSRVIWPPDGLNLKQGTCGELFGYGYLPLPLTEPKKKTAGRNVPTGNQCWTLFVNSKNFKGPIAFFTPYFFSRSTMDRADLHGKLLDNHPSDPNRQMQMETQYIPSVSRSGPGQGVFARVAPTSFPADAAGDSVLIHQVRSYRRAALWDGVEAWFKGGKPSAGRIDPKGAVLHEFTGKGWSSWKISTPKQKKGEKVPVAWQSFANPFAPDPHTFAYRWQGAAVKKPKSKGNGKSKGVVSLPRYYHLKGEGKKARWQPLEGREVSERSKLDRANWGAVKRVPAEPYVTPTDGCWATPGPVAGPFKAYPGDGSVVTYCWYRFADQPAILNADLSDAERARLQKRIEMIHRRWTKDREYLPPPTRGDLAVIDAALIVEPPKGFEIGYVPIVIRQEARR